MQAEDSSSTKCCVQTASGSISYTENGTGSVALFVHGVVLDNRRWRLQLEALSDLRRVIAVDLLTHEDMGFVARQLSDKANVIMLGQFLSALEIDEVDLVGTGSGCGTAQIFAATHPERVRSLTLTDCVPHGDVPLQPPASFVGLVAAGHLRDSDDSMRSKGAVKHFSQISEAANGHPADSTNEALKTYVPRFLTSGQRTRDREQFVTVKSSEYTVAIVSLLKELNVPSLMVWNSDGVYFGVEWSHALRRLVPGTERRVEFEDAWIFFSDEDSADFDRDLRSFWQKVDREAN